MSKEEVQAVVAGMVDEIVEEAAVDHRARGTRVGESGLTPCLSGLASGAREAEGQVGEGLRRLEPRLRKAVLRDFGIEPMD